MALATHRWIYKLLDTHDLNVQSQPSAQSKPPDTLGSLYIIPKKLNVSNNWNGTSGRITAVPSLLFILNLHTIYPAVPGLCLAVFKAPELAMYVEVKPAASFLNSQRALGFRLKCFTSFFIQLLLMRLCSKSSWHCFSLKSVHDNLIVKSWYCFCYLNALFSMGKHPRLVVWELWHLIY